MDILSFDGPSLSDELRLHARYIRDTLVPLLSERSDERSEISPSDIVLLQSIFKKLASVKITIELLRFSRIEKALMMIAATGPLTVSWENST